MDLREIYDDEIKRTRNLIDDYDFYHYEKKYSKWLENRLMAQESGNDKLTEEWKCPECGGVVVDNTMAMVRGGELKEVLKCTKCHELFVRDSFIKLWDVAFNAGRVDD